MWGLEMGGLELRSLLRLGLVLSDQAKKFAGDQVKLGSREVDILLQSECIREACRLSWTRISINQSIN